ncbi:MULTISPECIES: bifunctional pyr operon transcriptional regulator/uracil phosphoribosyltransferase PyrR [Persicobacter]|uniref:Bifunctional pyrimidine operon regulatory protein/uracil phosphoribosyltransferase n=1 Tax=Persicobacter diffluens TaxID=981 RepID=A0AAN4VXP3_9BACT|nr:bifunctional pyr operon transcriptional regulator/uracil phosphoribosyltransferase PyrR [Persicobacter sp. CCB-QB2]GJM60961.1 bifunctional pyrimidine operon regulatory protein/uracil phosphoribosyltransferase [Persicobacter diffluens]
MNRRKIFSSELLDITIQRMTQQLIENHGDFEDTVILALQPRGVFLAERLKTCLEENIGRPINLGYLDITFHRDDFRRREKPLQANTTHIPFLIENKKVILVDDVLYTGRSVRAAMDAMITFGRPQAVELAVLIDRKYTRDLPIEPNVVGQHVNTVASQRIEVELKGKDYQEDSIWLTEKTQD